MEQYLTIGEVSRLLDIPESTLRYWQDKGIFEIDQGKNNYRKYTIENLIHIAEIAFYRNIGIPVKKMEHFSGFCLGDYSKILREVEIELEKKMQLFQSMHKAAQLKNSHIKDIQDLKKESFLYGRVPFDTIVRFEYSDRDKLIRYTKNPSLYVRYMDTHDLGHDIRGIQVSQAEPDDTLLWQKEEDKSYAVFLIEEIASENYINNIPDKLSLIQSRHKTGILLANFLMSEATAGKRIDYLKGYAEILD